MKQAKLLLAIIGISAITGIALAFRAAKFNNLAVYTCSPVSTCGEVDVQAVSSTAMPNYTQVTNITTDANSVNRACNNGPHPCTATLWVLASTMTE